MYDEERLKRALVNAHRAGDKRAAQAIADRIAANRTPAPEPSMLTRLGNAWSGNAAEKLPDLYGDEFAAQAKGVREKAGRSDFRESASLSASAVFGDDEDVLTAVRRQFPEAEVEQDANGNPVVRMPDGQRYYVNQPGMDVNDAGRFAGKVLSFLPAARAAGTAARLLPRMGLAAAGAGATDVGMQLAAGRSELDPVQTAVTAGTGAAAELVAPWLGKGYRAARDWFRTPTAQAKAGRGLARGAPVDDEAARFLASQEAQIVAGAKPEALLAEREFGYRLSQGQRTGNEAVLRREELLRHAHPTGPLGQLERHNIDQTAQNVERMRRQAANGGVPEAFEQDAAQRAQEALQAAQRAGKTEVRQAYGAVPRGAAAAGEDVLALGSRPAAALRSATHVTTPQVTPNAVAAQKLIRETVGAARPVQAAQQADTLAGLGGRQAPQQAAPQAVGMEKLIELRKGLSKFANAKGISDQDRAATSIILKDFDSWFDEAITRNLMQGQEAAVPAFRNAQQVAARYFAKFADTKSASGKAITQMLKAETPEQVANLVLNANGINKPGAASIVRRYVGAVGKDSDGYTALREIVARRLFEKAGDPKGHQALVSSLKDSMSGRGRSLMGELFTETELAQFQRFSRVLDDFFVPKGMLGRSSGTAERLAAMASSLLKLPGGNYIKLIADDVASRAATRPLLAKRAALGPAAAAAGAESYPRKRR